MRYGVLSRGGARESRARGPCAVAGYPLTPRFFVGALCAMATPTEENFKDYKQAEKKALALLAEMKAVSPKKVDIELALLVAIFELHKGTLAAETIAGIVQGHLKTLLVHYGPKAPPAPAQN